MNRPTYCVVVLLFALAQAACASPSVDRAAPEFSEFTYQRQLAECRLSTAGAYTWRGAVGAMFGAAMGASHGALAGGEGAAIGAAVGSVLGLGVGAVAAIEKETASVDGCIREKGYALMPG
ncbi:MAG: hypothetical protein EXQ86_11900 [Rhodospirillales bacterium]|nr:hypothetical protein [Rhodospirillales bacterium]